LYALHDFTGGSDGGNPQANFVMDAAGNIYGTIALGGNGQGGFGNGTVFEIIP
jgi:hypothetical protein